MKPETRLVEIERCSRCEHLTRCLDCVSYTKGVCWLHGVKVRGTAVGKQCFKARANDNAGTVWRMVRHVWHEAKRPMTPEEERRSILWNEAQCGVKQKAIDELPNKA